MRTLLARWLHDTSNVEWSEAELNELLNLAYSKVQKEIVKVHPGAHLFWDYIDTAAGTSWYPLPQTFGVHEVSWKATAADTTYTYLGAPKLYQDVKDLATTARYVARRGQWIGIFPAPSVAVTRGIELVHSPVMAMSDDDEIARIKVPLHEAVVLWAKMLALGDTEENPEQSRARLKEILDDLAAWYEIGADGPDRIQVLI